MSKDIIWSSSPATRCRSSRAPGRGPALIELLESRTLRSASALADINHGSVSSLPENFNVLGSQVLFLAYDSARGQMLWSTDGTAGGTKLVKDINPSPTGGAFVGFGGNSIVIGNTLYFTGSDATHGVELWKTDGTANGTVLVDDLTPGAGSTFPDGFTNFNGKLAFAALGQLWVTDGTAAGTLSLGNFSPTGSGRITDRMVVMGNELYFMRYGAASVDGHSTGELWKTDGTVAGTSLVFDVSPGSDGRNGINAVASNLINVNNTLYFAADDITHGWELWKSDGTSTGTALVKDLAPPPTGGVPVDGSYPDNLTNVKGTLFFTAADAIGGTPELYKLDSTGQPVKVFPANIVGPAGNGPANPVDLTVNSSGLYFVASDPAHGQELWTSDGTTAGTQMVKDIRPGTNDSDIQNLTAAGNKLYFSADDGSTGLELWTSDGTTAGTRQVADVAIGSDASSPGPVTVFSGKLIFAASTPATGREPFAFDTNGKPAAPTVKLIVDHNPPAVSGTAPAGSKVFLFADGAEIGSTVAAGDGSYTVTSTQNLSDGTHSITTSDQVGDQTSALSPALSITIGTPSATPPDVKLLSTSPTEIDLKFTRDVSASFSRRDFTLTNLKSHLRIAASNIRIAYNKSTNTAKITFVHLPIGKLAKGHYRLRIAASKVTDSTGTPLSADASFAVNVVKVKKAKK